MRISWALASPVIVAVGCGSGASPPETDVASNDGGHGQEGISPLADGAAPDRGARDSGPGQDGASPPADAAATASEAGTIGQAGNPSGSCTAGVPVRGKPADTSHPTAVVGTGTPASCTFAALQAAVAQGGIITFDCGNGAGHHSDHRHAELAYEQEHRHRRRQQSHPRRRESRCRS